jgi:hypothetical protein
MARPPAGSGLTRISWTDYSVTTRNCWGVYAGLLCSLANMLQFQGGRLIGFATGDLVQAYPIVSTLWDIYLFGEYRLNDAMTRGATATSTTCCDHCSVVTRYLVVMYILYMSGIVCMVLSAAI